MRRVGRSGLDLPAISLGLWHNFGDDVPLERQQAILRRAFDRGVTHFDLANNYGPPYGSAERNLARSSRATSALPRRADHLDQGRLRHVARALRLQGGGSRKYVSPVSTRVAERMGLDYVDIFYSHRFDPRPRWRRPWARWTPLVRQGKACTSASRPTPVAHPRGGADPAQTWALPLLIHQPSTRC
jgi:L-glyceraldehyde 3-phosphate reductase